MFWAEERIFGLKRSLYRQRLDDPLIGYGTIARSMEYTLFTFLRKNFYIFRKPFRHLRIDELIYLRFASEDLFICIIKDTNLCLFYPELDALELIFWLKFDIHQLQA